MELDVYLRRAASMHFARGEFDCCIFLADWVRAHTGRDPAEGLRGYSTDTGAMLRIARAGGFVQLVGERLEAIGCKRVQAPIAGDVGVVTVGDRLTCAIFAGAQWAVKEGDGLMLGTFVPRAIWRL